MPDFPRLIVVRHGETDWNVEKRYQGQLDIPLNENGHIQAKAVAEVLVAFNPDVIITSDLLRTQQTAAPLAALTGLKPILDPGLREVNVGAWQGLLASEAAVQFPEEFAAFQAGEDVRRGGGETIYETGARGAKALLNILETYNPDQTVIAFSHGMVMRAAMDQLREASIIEIDGPTPHLKNTQWICISHPTDR